ncbi:MAG: N-acyl homoserine lactonase family protein [Bradyrhizobium sp.]|nr:MAG: N-acyl homoserine lactonase family protein [Bradyrhizobium sp.]
MRIHAISTGLVRIKSSQVTGQGHGLRRRLAPLIDNEWTDWLPTYAFAIEHPDGVIVVDSGANAGLKRLPRWNPYFQFAVNFDIAPEQELAPQLRAIGIGQRDVRLIALTHLHIDHDGGLAGFPHARVLVAAGELAATAGVKGRMLGYLPQRWPSGFDPEPLDFTEVPYGPFARSRRLTADGAVIAIPTPGHTPDHVSVVVEDGETRVVLAGDAAYSEASLLSGTVDGVSPDEGAALATLAKLRALATERPMIFLPTHDPRSAERLARRECVALPVPAIAA